MRGGSASAATASGLEGGADGASQARGMLEEPLEHIFTHVRHTMHVEYAALAEQKQRKS